MFGNPSYADKGARAEGVYDRRMVFCPRLQEFSMEELIVTCKDCNHFAIFCCPCSPMSMVQKKSCHKYRLIFTDGACRDNGAMWATSGVGAAVGPGQRNQLSLPITPEEDGNNTRTSQRAELLGAIHGLAWMGEMTRNDWWEPEDGKAKKKRPCGIQDGARSWVIATDSEYVVKGITEWLPQWKENNFRTNRNTIPANLDLFLELEEEIETQEAIFTDLQIGFWHVGREYNTIADRLAKEASRDGDPSY